MVKVLHIVRDSYPLSGGYVIRTENILDNIDSSKYAIDVAGSIIGRKKDQMKKGEYFYRNSRSYYQMISKHIYLMISIIEKLPKIRIFFHYFYILINSFLVLANINVRKYKIIHGHSTFMNGISALIVAKIFNKKFIYDIHCLGIDGYKKKGVRYKIEKYLEAYVIKKSEAIIVIDSSLKEHVFDLFAFPKDKIYVAANGIDFHKFQKKERNSTLLKKHNMPEGKFLIGIDNSKPLEGFEFIYSNREKIFNHIDNIHFIVFGSKQKESYDDEHFTFLPRIEFNEMVNYYNLCDLFIMPRIKTKQTNTVTPLKILEIMSCGVPLLISDVGGLTSCVIDSKTGYVFKEGSICSLIDRINTVVENKNISTITEASINWVRSNKSWKTASEQYEKCYENILS